MANKKLHLGRMTGKEMAEWFNMSASNYSKFEVRMKCYDILAKYADYHLETKGNGKVVVIDEIFESTYVDEKGPPARLRVKELVEQNWDADGLDSCSRVAQENYPILQAEGYSIAESTNYRYTCGGRTELWGSPVKLTAGEKGHCRYEWCKKDTQGRLVPLTIEEEKIKQEVTKKYFGSLESWTLGILDDLKKKKITQEEAGQALENLDAHGEFSAWRAELEARLGQTIYKGTRVIGKTSIEEFIWE